MEQIQQVLILFSANSPPKLRHLSYSGTKLYPCVVEVSRLGLEPLCDTQLRLSVILKTLTLTGQEFLEVSCVVHGGGPDTYSVRPTLVYLSSFLIHRQLLPYRHLTHGYLG